MFSNLKGNHAVGNRKAVFGSPILAKAVLKNSRGEIQIIAVFQKSTRQEFYWVFRAPSARSSRRSWKYVDHYARDFFAGRAPYFDFGSLVAYHGVMRNLAVLSQRIPHKKKLSGILVKTEHDSIYGNWTPQNPLNMKTDLCRRRAAHARDRRLAW